jgi:threonyl-tRNA synthetase
MSKSSIAIHLPDGSIKEVPAGTTPLDIANSISPRLAAASVVARLTPMNAAMQEKTAGESEAGSAEAAMYAAEDASAPRLVDLSTPLNEDVKLELLKETDPESLKVVRHSAAHVLATAVLELFPETKLGHGPATELGFFYDFYREKPFTPEDLAAIEKKMAEVVARDEKFVREYEPREQALAEFDKDGDFMKTHFVTKFTEPGSQVSFYRNGKFVDLRGRTGWAMKRIRSFSASTARRSSRRKRWMHTSRGLRRRRSATIACLASSWTCFRFRSWRGRGLSSGMPRAESCAK